MGSGRTVDGAVTAARSDFPTNRAHRSAEYERNGLERTPLGELATDFFTLIFG